MAKILATIQARRGAKQDFDATRMKAGELAVTTDGSDEAYVAPQDGRAIEFLKAILGKADKKIPTASGNLAALDGSGNLLDTGKKYPTAATTSADGLMAASDKTKLNGIEAGAQKNTVTGVKGSSESSYRTGNVSISAENVGAITKVSPATAGNLAALTAAGELTDSGKKSGDFAPDGYVTNTHIVSSDADITTALEAEYTSMGNSTARTIVLSPQNANTAIGGGNLLCTIFRANENNGSVIGYNYNTNGKMLFRPRLTTWQDWQWVNPPMAVGVEYRTTERWMGNPVYTQLVDLGTAATKKTVSWSGGSCFRYAGKANNYPFPAISGTLDSVWSAYIHVERNSINLYCGSSVVSGGWHCYAQLWYTK